MFEHVTNQGVHMAQRSYDSWITNAIDDEYKRFCEGEDFNPIKDPKEAVFALIEELFDGVKFNELRASQALQCLAKHHKVDTDDVDFDHPNVVTPQQLESAKIKAEILVKDYKKAFSRHVTMLKNEIYGDKELDHQTINGAISNLEWLSDQEILDKKVKIRRA
jgi:hypothetical protein